MKKAYRRSGIASDRGFQRFVKDNSFWLPDYALFMALKDAHKGKSWALWEDPLRFREKEALEAANLTPEASNEEICDALISAIQEVNYNGLTGEGMTWNELGEVSKSPKAVIIQDGGYVSVQ